MIKDFFDKPFTLDRIARIFFRVFLIVAFIFIFRYLAPILIPFAISWFIAYLLMPVVTFFQYKLHFKNRILSVLVVLLLFIGLISGIVLILAPSINNEVNKSWELIQYYASTDTLKNILPKTVQDYLAKYNSLESMVQDFNMEKILQAAQQFVTKSWSLVAGTVSFLMSFTVVFLSILYLIFIMKDYEDLNDGVYKLVPRHLHSFLTEAIQNIQFYINSYFKGQSLIALCVGVLLAIGFKLIGLPLAISLGLLIGLLNLIPYLQIAGIVPIIILSGLKSADTGQNFFFVLALSLGVLLLVQIIQDTILTPRIMGKSMGMKPAIILVSLSIWGYMLGLLGMLFALPVTMIIYTYYMKYFVGEPIENGPLLEKKKPSIITRKFLSKEEEEEN